MPHTRTSRSKIPLMAQKGNRIELGLKSEIFSIFSIFRFSLRNKAPVEARTADPVIESAVLASTGAILRYDSILTTLDQLVTLEVCRHFK